MKGLTYDLSRGRVVSLGGSASEVSIGAGGAKSRGRVPVHKVAQDIGWIGRGGSRILAQAKEGRGSPDDDKYRHRGSLEIIISIGYKKGALLPLCVRYRIPHR